MGLANITKAIRDYKSIRGIDQSEYISDNAFQLNKLRACYSRKSDQHLREGYGMRRMGGGGGEGAPLHKEINQSYCRTNKRIETSLRYPLKFLPSCLPHLFLFLLLCPRMNTVVTSFTLFALQIFFESSVPIIHTLQWLCLITPLRRPLLTPQRSVFC